MTYKQKNLNAYLENAVYYPFIVSETDSNGQSQFSQRQTKMHGFGILTDGSMGTKFFNHENEGGVKQGTEVYEIRVKSSSGVWQDWQAVVGNIQIVSFVEWKLENSMDNAFQQCKKKFQNNFQFRYSGVLWRSHFGEVTILDEKTELIKKVNPFTLKIEYNPDLDNSCYSYKQQMKDQKRFRKKYYTYDEEGKRL